MTIDEKGMARLERLVKKLVEEGARAGAKYTKEQLSGSGSGKEYSNLPRRSSAPGEYPAKQSGQLAKKIQMRKVDNLNASFGAVKATQYMLNLEFFPASLGGRKWLTKIYLDKGTHEAIINAVTKLAGGSE
jgi:hypothetical protein